MLDGLLLGAFLSGYGVFRFFLEFFREPEPQLGLIIGVFSMGQILCVVMMGIGVFIFWRCERRTQI